MGTIAARLAKQWPLVVLLAASFLAYWSTLGLTAFSDDHSALWNAGVNGIPWRNGFFRPISDLTFRIGFLLHGTDSLGHRVFNVALHGLNAFLVHRLVRGERRNDPGMGHSWAAWVAALLFICYPYHMESIVWLVGRESALGTCAVLGVLNILLEGTDRQGRWVAAGILFLGSLCYESVLLLPLMVLPLYAKGEGRNNTLIALLTAVFAHMLVRTLAVGWSTDSYLPNMVLRNSGHLLMNLPKVLLRLFLPPDPDIRSQTFKGIVLILVLLLSGWVLWRRGQKAHGPWIDPRWTWFLVVSCLIPVITSVSTRTSESDRFLHLPSAFLCGIMALLLARVPHRMVRWTLVSAAFVMSTVLLRVGQGHWAEASTLTTRILDRSPDPAGTGRCFLLDLPDSYKGAFIFRNGFPEAVHLRGRDGDRMVDVRPADIQRTAEGRLVVLHRGRVLVPHPHDHWYAWVGEGFRSLDGPPDRSGKP